MGLRAGESTADVVDGPLFLLLRFDTVPVVVLLFSEEPLELELPFCAFRVLRLRAMGTSGNDPTAGVLGLDARAALAADDIATGVSMSMLSGSSCTCS